MPLDRKTYYTRKPVKKIRILYRQEPAAKPTLITRAFFDIFGLFVIAYKPVAHPLHIVEEETAKEVDCAYYGFKDLPHIFKTSLLIGNQIVVCESVRIIIDGQDITQ